MSEDRLHDIYCELADISATLAIMASKPDMVLCRECKYAQHFDFTANTCTCHRGVAYDADGGFPTRCIIDGCAEGAKKEAD